MAGISATALAAASVLATSAHAADPQTQWTGSAFSSWFDPVNWSSGVPGPWTALGTYPYDAIVDNAAGSPAVIGAAGAEAGKLFVGQAATSRLNVTAGGTLTVPGYAGSGVLTLLIGDLAGGNGTMVVSGAGANVAASGIAVGRAGTGRMEVTGGALVDSTLGYVGADTGSHGTVVVDAAGWNVGQLFVGSYGTGDLTLQNGGKVTVSNALGATAGMYANSVGTITVDGSGSVFEDQGAAGSMTLGYNGTGHLVVSGQGKATSVGTCIGCGSGGVGTALVTGAGSQWQLTGLGNNYVVGGAGTGTLTVADGGLFRADNGLATVTFGSTSTGRGTLHLTTGGKAQFSSLNLGGWVAGSAGGIGEAIVESGGQLSSKGGNLGQAAGTLGKMTVTGAGSRWDHAAQVTLGYEGRGEMVVSAGGQVASQSGTIASNPGSTGTATVTGAGSQWTNTQFLSVGNRGVGSLFVADHGAVSASSLSVGPGGQGTIEITGGGQVTAGTAMIGTNAVGLGAMTPTTGDVLVSGAGSALTLATYAWIGSQDAQGTLTIADGATVSVNNGIYDGPTFAGVVYMGDDSTAGSTGILNIGGSVAAVAPGTLTAAGVAFNTSADTLNFNHTSANYAFAPSLAGSGTVNVRAGTTHLTGDSSVLGGFEGHVNVLGGSLYVDNRLGAGSNGLVDVSSGARLGGTGAIAGAVTVADGGILEGRSGQVLTMGSLALNANSNVDVALGAPSAAALFNVAGSFTLDGKLNATDAGGLSSGTYRLADYGGALTNNGLVVTSVPAGFNPGDWSIDTATAGQVNLLIPTMGAGEQYWDGASMVPGDGINGGDGTWNTSSTNWTNQASTINGPWAGGTAVFANSTTFVVGNVYTVAVDAGGVTAGGLRAENTGIQTYTFAGGAVTLDPAATITTGARGFTFRSALNTLGGLTITGEAPVTLLDGDDTFAGPLTIENGDLRLEAGSAGPGLFTNATVRMPNDSVTVGQAGTGRLIVNQGSALYTKGGTLAAQAGSTGSVDVSNDSIWDAGTGDIVVGDAGTGTLRVIGLGYLSIAPSHLTAGNIILGRSATGRGTLTVMDRPAAVNATRVSGGTGGGEVIFDGGSGASGLFAPTLGGNLSVSFLSGETSLAGINDYTGPTSVSGGALLLQGASLTGTDVSVATGKLGGFGTIGGAVAIASGGRLSGESGQTLAMGSLALNEFSSVEVTLGAPNAQPIFDVSGNLVLDGKLDVTGAAGYGDGVYRLFDYGGTLADNGLDIRTLPTGSGSALVQTAVANQVNLVVGNGGPGPVPTTQFWNGATTVADGTVHGGPGIWSAGPATNWTDANGLTAAAWNGNFAVFQNNPDAVTVDNGAGAVSTTGMQFIGSGWTVGGDAVTLDGTGGSTTIRVGDGTAAGASSSAAIDSALTGGSRLVKDDLGALILTGANSYFGGTAINAGTLQIGNGGTTGSISGNVLNNGTFAFDRSDGLTFAGAITGNGTLRQAGGGMTTLTGNSAAFAGTTDVAAGTLAVNGALGGALNVQAGGRLQGTGTVGDTAVSGTIAPGNSIGTLQVGSITFNAGSTYEVEVDAAGQTDLIEASGGAIINGGSVQVLAGMGNYAPATTYTILTAAGGRTGTFTGGVTSNLAFLDPSLGYDANNVYLSMTRNGVGFTNVGITPNQIAAGDGVESLGSGNPVYDAVLNLSAGQARYAFDQVSGEVHASMRTMMVEDSRFLRTAVNDRIRAAFDGVGAPSGDVVTYEGGKPRSAGATTDGAAFWGHAFGSWGHWNSDGNAARLGRSIGGIFFGGDVPVFETWRLGVLAGYGHSSFDADDRHSSGSSDDYHVGLYGGTNWGDLAFRTGAAYTWHDVTTARSVAFPGFGNSLEGDYDAGTAQVFGELGYRIEAGTVAFEPFADLAYVNLHTDGFTEKGGAAALTGGAANTDATFTTLGLRATTRFDLGGTTVTAKGMLGWRHAFGDVTPDAALRFASGDDVFSIGGVPIARDAATIEAGLDFAQSANASFGVSYAGQFGSGLTDQSVRANFNVRF